MPLAVVQQYHDDFAGVGLVIMTGPADGLWTVGLDKLKAGFQDGTLGVGPT
jgi:hypothetical protein